MKSGEEHVAEIRYPKGHEKNPMTDDEIERKFHELCAGRLDAGQRERALAALWQLENIGDTAEITALFAVP